MAKIRQLAMTILFDMTMLLGINDTMTNEKGHSKSVGTRDGSAVPDFRRTIAQMAINNLAVLLKMALEKLNAPADVLGAHEDGDTDAVLAFLEHLPPNIVVTHAATDAVWAADYLSEQQAMPDDGYKARLESARAVLANVRDETRGQNADKSTP
jgi:hypothetical protein